MNYSKIISGTMNWGAWGSNLSTKKVADLIVNSIEFGINTFDNADIYGGYTTEELFGNGLAESGIERERIKIISKFGIMYPSDKLPIKVKHYDYSKGHIVKSIENSLKNLKTDYIDCVLLHRPSPLMDINEISDTINELLNSGKIKSFGVSNFSAQHIQMFDDKVKIDCNQIQCSLTHLEPIYDGTLDYMQTKKIKPMAWKPLGEFYKADNDQIDRIKEKVKKFTKKYNCSETQILLAWLIKHPSNIIPVVGTTKIDRLKESIDSIITDIELVDWFEILEASEGKRVP
ncbi:MAG: aldo/keto reductase [Pelagibacterales bacterium]|jgi:predicted oxidoreductase|nr:aldo/keto reductase [Pelagibacterales bacterium]